MAVVNPTEPSISIHPKDLGSRNGALHAIPSVETNYLEPIPVKQVSYAKAKRLLDIVLSIIGLIVLSPVFLICALLVRFTSRGEVVFKQTRVGEGGRLFTCYKFRSMRKDAEKHKSQLAHLNELDGPVFKIKNDPRVTFVGKYMRKLSLDELPQIVNVLKGEMTIVGPRPPVPREVSHYNDRELGRLAVKPGLTCLWQINGRSNVNFDHWVEMDLLYIDTMSFWGDVKIIAKTVPAVVFCRGAH
jgi:lipopolysaccharide/colanic/teichoic acid biosynthesis glycosyltransferase